MTVSKEQIRAELLKNVTENTSYDVLIDGLTSGGKANVLNFYVDSLYKEVNQLHILTQEDIDEQNANYSEDYLFEAGVGSLVYAGDNEVYLSLANIEDCVRAAEDRLNDDYNDIDDIAHYVKFVLIATQLQ